MGLFTSGSVGGYDYLHYHFSNSGYEVQDFSSQKNLALRRQYAAFTDRQRLMIDGDALEGFHILDDISSGQIIGNELENEIANLFNGNGGLPTAASNSGLGDRSYGQLGATIRSGQTRGLATELINSAGECQEKLDEALKQITSILEAAYPDFVELALNAADKAINSYTYQEIIQKFVTSGYNFVEVPSNIDKSYNNIIQSVAKIRIAIDAIPMLNSSSTSAKGITVTHSHSKAHGVSNKSELIAIFFGKVGGILSGLSGSVEEIAVGHGLEGCIKKAGEEFSKTKAYFVGGKIQQWDSKIEEDANVELATGTYNKNDVTLVITKDKVILTFGASVKTTKKTNETGIPIDIKLHDGTNLLEALKKVQGEISAHYIYNLAGGLQKTGEASLQQGWRSLVDYAVALNFMDYLVGKGFANNNNLILVANRKIYSMKEILMGIADHPEAIEYSGGKMRYPFWQLNEANWIDADSEIDVETAAEYRSAKTTLDITNKFMQTKMTISLNLALALS